MALDPHYIPAFSIEDVLLDKDTGAPLTGGLVYFEQDNQRGILKPVYQITGVSPDYTYTQLPNPMTLSSIGTFEDALANPTIPYFYPYDENLDVELYYVRVTSSEDVAQFDREAVPYISRQENQDILSVITNELSNPQFAVVNFDTSAGAYTFNVNAVTDSVINIAPDWDLVVSAAGAGTITLTQGAPVGSLNLVTNAGTYLRINSSGLSKLHLRQRLFGSPNLWGSGYISSTFAGRSGSSTAVDVTLLYSQSNGTVVNQTLTTGSLAASGAYNTFPNSFLIPASNSTESFPGAYIDIFFDLPLSTEIDITSVMVASTGSTSIANIVYDQESYARQIDHIYHDAYPIVPVGTVIDFAGFTVPLHYLYCDGTAYNRITYYQLFSMLTATETVSLTSTVATFTVVDGTKYAIGMNIEGTGITAGTTITNIVTNTITISVAATQTISSLIRFFISGNGDGSTTFNVPDLRGYVIAGSGVPTGVTLFGSYGAGAKGGDSTSTLIANNIPAHTHPPGGTATTFVTRGNGSTIIMTGGAGGFSEAAATGNNATTTTPVSIVQATFALKKCIRFE